MTDRESFVAAIAANPDDDTPRLAFADWLEENGDAARAGFVRDQVRLAKMPAGTEEYRELFMKTGATLRANLPAWIQDACDAFGQSSEWYPIRTRQGGLTIGVGRSEPPVTIEIPRGFERGTFERGFLEDPQICVHRFRDGTPLNRLLGENPITRMAFSFYSASFRQQDAIEPLRRIRSLSVIGNIDESSSRTFFQLEIWTALQFLSLYAGSPHAVLAMCRSPVAKRLHGLKLSLMLENLNGLAAFPLDDRLREISFSPSLPPARFSEARPRILPRLSALPFRPTLKKLSLAGCHLQDAGLAGFARGEVWIRLRSLALDRNRFGDPGWRDFARGRRTPELRVLTASRNFLTNDGAIRLGDSSLVETLEYVDLRGNRIEGKGAMALARPFAVSPLKKLLLAGNPIREADAKAVRKVLGGRVDIG